jgi:tRNA (cytidine/uridine-2'-O-)-methyltransferase
LCIHANWQSCLTVLAGRRLIAVETCASNYYHEFTYHYGDVLLFGNENNGLPDEILSYLSLHKHFSVRLPMRHDSRSLNLSNAVAISAYEAWRQLNFINGA